MADIVKEMLVEIKTSLSNFKKDMKDVKSEANKAAGDVDKAFSSKQLKFNTTVAKANFRELTALKKNLDAQYIKGIDLKINSESLVELRRRISLTNNELEKYKITSNSVSSKSGGGAGILGLIGGLGIATGVGVGIASFTSFMKDSIVEAREAQQVYAQVQQVVKSTGAAAGYSAGQFKALADEMEKLAGIDGDRILKESILQLATFRNISGNTFKQATQAALDLSATMGNDLQGATIMIGKALNSPKEGVSALTRVGIQFSDEQKKLIEGFLKINDVASAQAVILKELNTQFGGQAKALNDAAGGANNLAVAWGNLKENTGKGFMGEFFTGVVDGAGKAINQLNILINKIGTVLGFDAEGKLNKYSGEVEQRTRNIQNNAFKNNNQGAIDNAVALDKARREANKYGLQYLEDNNINIEYKLNVSGTKEEQLKQINDAIKENENLAYSAAVKTDEWWNALKKINALKLQKLQVQNPNDGKVAGSEDDETKNFNKQKKAFALEVENQRKLKAEKERLSKVDAREADDSITKAKNNIERISADMVKAKDQETYDKLEADKKYNEESLKLAQERFDILVDETQSELDLFQKGLADKTEFEKQAVKDKIEQRKREQDAEWETAEKALEKQKDKIKKENDAIMDVASAGANAISDSFFAIANGERNIADGIADAAKSFGVNIASMIVNALALKAVFAGLNLIPGVGGALSWLFSPNFSMAGSGISGISAPEISQNYGDIVKNYNMPKNNNDNSAILAGLNRVDNSLQTLNRNLINKDLSVNISPTMSDLEVVKTKINPAQKRVNKSGYKR